MSLEILNSNITKSGILSLDNLEKGFSLIPDTEKTEYKSDKFVNLTLLLDDIRSNNLNLRNHQMVYNFKKYISNSEQTYILDNNKNHIDISAKIGVKNGSMKLRLFGIDKPYMEVFFDENGKLMYTITFRYEDSMQTAIELKTDSFKEYKNMLLYLGYGDIEKDKNSSAFFIREFTRFLNSSSSSDNLYNVYGDIPLSLILKIQLTTEKVVDHLKILTERDNTGFFSWAEDTSSLLVKVLAMFRKAQEVSDYFWKNPKFLIEIYDNLDGFSEPFGIRMSNRIIFASVLNNFVSRSKIDKSRISANTLRSGQGYFVESDILEVNDTLNTIKGILSFDWDFDFKDAVFLQQKRTYKKIILRQDLTDEGKPIGNNKVSETVIITEDIDPGYLYHPMHLVHFLDGEKQKANLVTALFIKAVADGKEWEQVMRNIRMGGDIFAIILGTLTLGSASVLALTDIGLATVDLTLMSEDVKEWLSQSAEGKWFVENWDLIYGLVGAGIMSVVIIDGILTYGPELLQKIKNLKNIRSNYRIFVQELEKLVSELEAYRIANPVENAIDEIKLIGDKNSIWKKVLNLASAPEKYIEKIVLDLSAKGLSARKQASELYEVLYNGKTLFTGKDFEVGRFLKQIHFKNIENAEEFANKIVLTAFSKTIKYSANLKYKGIIYEVTKIGGILKWKFSDELSKYVNRADLSEFGSISYEFHIPDELRKRPYGGFGQKFLNESFEIYGKDIKSTTASWNEYSAYPEGSSLGYKQFWKAFNVLGDKNEALKTTTFYKTMSGKGLSKLEKESVVIDDLDNSISVIIYSDNFK